MRTLILAVTLSFCVASAFGGDQESPATQYLNEVVASAEHADPLGAAASAKRSVSAQCCKVCTKGKACGDTCIAKNETCHVGPGCACDG